MTSRGDNSMAKKETKPKHMDIDELEKNYEDTQDEIGRITPKADIEEWNRIAIEFKTIYSLDQHELICEAMSNWRETIDFFDTLRLRMKLQNSIVNEMLSRLKK